MGIMDFPISFGRNGYGCMDDLIYPFHTAITDFAITYGNSHNSHKFIGFFLGDLEIHHTSHKVVLQQLARVNMGQVTTQPEQQIRRLHILVELLWRKLPKTENEKSKIILCNRKSSPINIVT